MCARDSRRSAVVEPLVIGVQDACARSRQSTSAVSLTSWLVAPQCTKVGSAGSVARTRSMSISTNGMVDRARRACSAGDRRAASKLSGTAARAIASPQTAAMIPASPRARASAASNRSIAVEERVIREDRGERVGGGEAVEQAARSCDAHHIEEDGLVGSLQPQVEHARRAIGARHQDWRSACRRRCSGTSAEHRIRVDRRIAGEVDARVQVTQQAAREQADIDVRACGSPSALPGRTVSNCTCRPRRSASVRRRRPAAELDHRVADRLADRRRSRGRRA